MDNLAYILFICLVAPMLLMLLLLRKCSRHLLFFMIIGICVSLFVSEFNTILLGLFNGDTIYVTTTITPISEEIAKAIPVLFYALVFSSNRDKVISVALATGIGFGMFENMVVLMQNTENVTLSWAIIRGFSTALMHGICTVAIGYGICFVKMRRKLFYCGIFALLSIASIYHGIFNMLVQSQYKYLGFVLPAVTYMPLLYRQYRYYMNLKKENKANTKT